MSQNARCPNCGEYDTELMPRTTTGGTFMGADFTCMACGFNEVMDA